MACNQVAKNLAQLMYSVLMAGYMFKNAQYQLELQQSLEYQRRKRSLTLIFWVILAIMGRRQMLLKAYGYVLIPN